jgi:hypothetical protein
VRRSRADLGRATVGQAAADGSAHGEFTLSAPGYGVISHVAGLELTDGIHHGVFRVVEDPQVAAELCAALTA